MSEATGCIHTELRMLGSPGYTTQVVGVSGLCIQSSVCWKHRATELRVLEALGYTCRTLGL